LILRLLRLLVAGAALAAIAVGIWQLQQATAGLVITRTTLGTTPVTVFRLPGERPAPVVVIAHGFAGSQQLMLPFATTLARNGYLAVTFDFPGHGRNPTPLAGGLTDDASRGTLLLDTLGRVVEWARPQGDGRVALLGHSMASDIVVRYAEAHPQIVATVAVSLFSQGITADSPRNLLVIDGALEPAMLTAEAARIVAMAAGGPPLPRVTYGAFAAGTARRMSLSGGVEHIGVLFSQQSLREALDWLDQAFGHVGSGWQDDRALWLGVLFAGIVGLAWPLSRLLPVAAAAPMGAGLRWRLLLPVAVAPAVLTPLLLWKVPTNFLPILLGDYLVVHFAVYGVMTAIGVLLVRRRRAPVRVRWGALAAAVAAVAAYSILALGLPLDRYVTSFVPTPGRLPLILAMLAGTAPYFIADEWATRGASAPWGGYAVTKLLFAASLLLAVTLNLQRLFFLIIIVPVILIFFIVYGLFSAWAFRRTQHPLVGGLANALAFAWAIAVTFPTVG
jgi:pimeloyl-ACP methyl ester carboxylesterase